MAKQIYNGGPKTGAKCKLYMNVGDHGSPVWNLVDEIGDVNLTDLNRTMAELKRRASEYTKNLPSLFSAFGVEFNLISGCDLATFNRIRNDFFDGTVREWAVMGGDIDDDDVQGMVVPGILENFPWDQPLEDVAQHSIRLVVGYLLEDGVEVDPYWIGGVGSSA